DGIADGHDARRDGPLARLLDPGRGEPRTHERRRPHLCDDLRGRQPRAALLRLGVGGQGRARGPYPPAGRRARAPRHCCQRHPGRGDRHPGGTEDSRLRHARERRPPAQPVGAPDHHGRRRARHRRAVASGPRLDDGQRHRRRRRRRHRRVTYTHAIVLGLVQGLTEFLPVSSSGHLILVSHFLGWPDQGLAFDAALHLGTLAALLAYFRTELIGLLTGAVSRSVIVVLAVATVPAVIVGLAFGKAIETGLRSPLLIAASTAFWAGVM